MTGKRPTAPKHLRPATRRWWLDVITGWELDTHHRFLLTLAGETLDRAAEARETLAREGSYFTDPKGVPREHPATRVERDCGIRFARLVRELDLDGEPGPEPSRPPRLRRTR